MKLSIITINYNNAEGLRRTLDSVAAQTYRDIEHIIVDGNSTDNSIDIIREYESSNSRNTNPLIIKWISEPDKGVYNAMTKGIEIAMGKRVINTSNSLTPNPLTQSQCDYIQILNSGDILAAPDVTERMADALSTLNIQHSTENSIPILYGNMLKSYDGKTIINRDTCGGGLNIPESFLYFYRGTLNHDCAYIRRDLFDKYGLYNEDMKICSDWEWYIKAIALGGEKPIYTNIDVTVFDMNGISESRGKNAELIKKERRAYLESIVPASVLRDYDAFAFPIEQYQRLRKYHLWGLVYFLERVLFKLEKWGLLK